MHARATCVNIIPACSSVWPVQIIIAVIKGTKRGRGHPMCNIEKLGQGRAEDEDNDILYLDSGHCHVICACYMRTYSCVHNIICPAISQYIVLLFILILPRAHVACPVTHL